MACSSLLSPIATVRVAVTIPARFVQPGDTIEYPGTSGAELRWVSDVSWGFVWVGGVRLDTVSLTVDGAELKVVVGADDLVTIASDVPDDQPEPIEPGERPWW